MKKLFSWLFLLFFIIFVFLVIYSYRSTFLKKYDNVYLRDLYDRSQWNLAVSKRTVGDDVVYKVTGYDLINNWSFFTIDPQTPVLGKYLFGYSIKIFNNAEISEVFIFFLSIGFFTLIATLTLKKTSLVKIAVILFVTEPIIFYQISLSMLDLPQLLCLLIHIYVMLRLNKNKNNLMTFLYTLIAGVSLGGFISLKIGFFAIAILLTDFIYLYLIKKLYVFIPVILLSAATYVFSYLPYFIKGNSLITFLKNQKWIIISYWLSSKTKFLPGMVIIATITGFIKGWYKNSSWQRVNEWTIFWPIYLIYFLNTIKKLKENYKAINLDKLFLIILTFSFLSLYILVPFYSRYLVLIIPLLIILSADMIAKINKKLLIIIIIIYVIQIISFLYPDPNNMILSLVEKWQIGTYQDIYDYIDDNSIKSISRADFWRQGQLVEKNLMVIKKDVIINIKDDYPWKNYRNGELTIHYQTPIGFISNNQKINLIRTNNQWKLLWNNNFLLNNYNPKSDQIIFETENNELGNIIGKDGQVVNKYLNWPYLYLTPNKINNEFSVQSQLTSLTGLKKYELEYIYKANWQPDWEVEIGPLNNSLSINDLSKFKIDKSITIKYKPVIFENKHLQLKPPKGGRIIIRKENQDLVILKKD